MTGGGQKSMWTQPRIDLRFLNNLSLSKLLPNLYYSDVPNPNTKSKLKLSFPNLFAFVSNSLHSIILISPRPPPPPPPQLPLPSPRPQTQIQKPTLNLRYGSESESGCSLPLFRPYVAKVPWHGGVRGFLSQMFPRYGHYCGPNWSSGKDKGSMLWDQRPIDWLDFCCYCHDIGYDTHDQSNLLKADLAFLDCLEKPRMATKGGAHLALLYRSMCIAGLRHVLIPYRMQLVRMQSRPPLLETLVDFIGLSSRRDGVKALYRIREGFKRLQPAPLASTQREKNGYKTAIKKAISCSHRKSKMSGYFVMLHTIKICESCHAP